jgi:hypothetical protein
MMAFFGIVAWIVFCIRDYWLLESLSAAAKGRAIRRYLISFIGTTVLVSLFAATVSQPMVVILSRPLLIAVIAVHAVFSVWSLWLGRQHRFSSAWRLALCPSPAAWILLFLGSAAVSGDDPQKAIPLTAGVAITSGLIVAFAGLHFSIDGADPEDFAFPIRFATCSNCLALCLVPLITS